MKPVRHIGDLVFEVGSEGHEFGVWEDMIVAPLNLIRTASATSFRNALRAAGAEHNEVWFTTDNVFDEERSPVEDYRLRVDAGELLVLVRSAHDPYEDATERHLNDLFRPVAARMGVQLVSTAHDESAFEYATLSAFRTSTRGKSVAAVIEEAERLCALAKADFGTGLTADTVADLVVGGRIDALLGQRESEWLDVKRSPPRLETVADRLELAKDVAAFANTVGGGLILYGVTNARTGSGDVLDKIKPFAPELFRPTQLRATINGRVYPAPHGLRIEVVPVPGSLNSIGMVRIPSQPPSRQPFLVRGGVTSAGQVRDTLVGIPTRVGEDTIWDDLAGIHGLLLAGRAAMSR